MAFPGLCLPLPSSLPPPWFQAGSPTRALEPGTPRRGGLRARSARRTAVPRRGLGWESPGPGRRRGRGGLGFCRRHPGLARPPLGPWEPRGSEGEEWLGWPGQRPPRRGGALTPGLDQWHGAFPGVAVETEAEQIIARWFLCSAVAHLLLRHLPMEWGCWGLGIPLRHQNRKAILWFSLGKSPRLGGWTREADCLWRNLSPFPTRS